MRRFLLPSLCLVACTTGTFSSIDIVTGLTVIGIKADPPDQLASYNGSAGTGIVVPFGLPLGSPFAPITVTALVADPTGGGRAIQVVISTCAQVDPNTNQCLPGTPDYADLLVGSYAPDGGVAITPSVTFTPTEQQLVDALTLDPLHGFAYIPVPVQISASAGSEQIVGVKTLTFTQPISIAPGTPPVPADVNPVIPVVNLNGALWDPDAGPAPIDGTIGIAPVAQPQLWTSYVVPEFDGGLIPFTEDWGYEFYTTAGTLSNARAGGAPRPGLGGFRLGGGRGPRDGGVAPDAGAVDAGIDAGPDAGAVQATTVFWSPDAGEPSQLVYYWIVVVDGRGGADFTQRVAQYEAP